MKERWRTIRAVGVALLAFGSQGSLISQSAEATPHLGQSVNVVIIGGAALDLAIPCAGAGPEANNMGATFGGCLPVTGPAGELGDFAFTPMDPPAVSAASLAPFDTAVLNVASSAMACSTGTLTAAQQADIVAFVGAGKKLIIYDSECSPQDYSWLPFPFTTSNPGALGAPGTLAIVEDNLLSTLIADPDCTLVGDPHCIDVAFLGPSTDAVGDMNVMTTFDPNWCLDMSGTNADGVTGPVHAYAKFPALADIGLIIYNGLDQDYQGFGIGEANLRKIWVQELQHPFNPSNLPCGKPVVGNPLTSVGTAQFTLRQERPGVADDQLVEVALFTLPSGAAIDPPTEAVEIKLSEPVCGGDFSSLSIPAGSFAARSGGKIALFNGVVADGVTGAPVTAAVRISRERDQNFKVSLDFKTADYICLEGTDHRKVRTTLTVGDDTMIGEQCFERLTDGDLFWPPRPGVVCP